MTPFERGINALLDLEERQCVRMHHAFHESERKTAYDSAVNTRICVTAFAKAYLNKDDFKKFEKNIIEMHSVVHMKSFAQLITSDGAGVADDSN